MFPVERTRLLRLFFAVLIPQEVQEAVARIQQELREEMGEDGIRWVLPEQFHYTLKFLGDTPEAQLPLVRETAQRVASERSAFSLALGGLGTFPAQRSPQILWIGASEGVPVLTQLAEYLDQTLAKRGFAPETRRFNPHLTLARIKSPAGADSVAKNLADLKTRRNIVDKCQGFMVKSFVLMRSELRPEGPEYTALETFTLSASPDRLQGEFRGQEQDMLTPEATRTPA